MLKQGSVAVTMLTVLAIVIFFFAFISFILYNNREIENISIPYLTVEKFNTEVAAKTFTDGSVASHKTEYFRKKGFAKATYETVRSWFGVEEEPDILEVSVQKSLK